MQRKLSVLLALVGTLCFVEPANSADPPGTHRRFLDYLAVGSHVTLGYAGNGSTLHIRLLTADQVERRKEAFVRYDKQTEQIRMELEQVRKVRQEGEQGNPSPNAQESRLLVELSKIARPQEVYRIVAVGEDFVEMRIAVQSTMGAKEDERRVVLPATHIGRIDIPTPTSRSAASDGKPKEANSRLESYKLNQADAESVAEVVREVYRDTKGIEITVDKQRSSILVVAPKEVHDLIRMLIDSAADAHRPRVFLVPRRSPFVSPGGVDLNIERGMKADELERRMRLGPSIERFRSEIAPIPNEQRPPTPVR